MPKNVFYLLGAGATHGMLQDARSRALMPNDVRDWILRKYESGAPPISDDRAWNEFTTTPEVEHFMSILEYQNRFSDADRIRQDYREAIVDIAGTASDDPPKGNLYAALLDYQLNLAASYLDEELLGFISFNYEDILENTISAHFGPVSYVFEHDKESTEGVPISVYKLHGSFNWLNTRPISIERMSSASSKPTIWIPPGIDKKKDSYPFNVLWGRLTEELLRCDVLRVIGCSLSRNDWGIIPVLYTIRHFTGRTPFDIEIIAPPSTARTIQSNYGYLAGVRSMLQISEVTEYFREEVFDGRTFDDDEQFNEELDAYLSDFDRCNVFRVWLLGRLRSLAQAGHSLTTNNGFAKEFYLPS